MTMEVLQDKLQIKKARKELINKGVSFIDSSLQAFLRKLRILRKIEIGDMVKSWDVLATINFLNDAVSKEEPILDIGCYASELIIALNKLGYTNLTGADLNQNIHCMPYQESIKYVINDFMRTKFQDASFRAITSISVIEHGFDGQKLLKETSRLLMTNGYFIASFDYWPKKIDTSNIKHFGMEWKIFSKDEVVDFITEAASYGLFPVGELKYDGKHETIFCATKHYTFAWLVLKKK